MFLFDACIQCNIIYRSILYVDLFFIPTFYAMNILLVINIVNIIHHGSRSCFINIDTYVYLRSYIIVYLYLNVLKCHTVISPVQSVDCTIHNIPITSSNYVHDLGFHFSQNISPQTI